MCLNVVCTACVHEPTEGKKRISDSLKLKRNVVVSWHTGFGTKTRSSIKAPSVLNCWATSRAPNFKFLNWDFSPIFCSYFQIIFSLSESRILCSTFKWLWWTMCSVCALVVSSNPCTRMSPLCFFLKTVNCFPLPEQYLDSLSFLFSQSDVCFP